MPPEPPSRVLATHDIRRFRTVVVKRGATGTVLATQLDSTGTSYTVVFEPAGLTGATIAVRHLSANDLQTAG